VVAYECLAGRRPFERETAVATALAHLNDPVPPLPASVPADLAAVVLRALAKRPAERFPDAGAFAAALRTGVTGADDATQVVTPAVAPAVAIPPPTPETQVLTGVGAPVPPVPPVPPGAAGPRSGDRPDEAERRSTMWVVALVVALLLAAALVIWLLLRSNADDAPPPTPQTPSATTSAPTATSSPTQTQTPATFDLDEGDYVGRDVDSVLAALRDRGLRPQTKELTNPGDETPDTVAAVSPTKGLTEGDTVEVAYYGRPAPEETPTPEQTPTRRPTTAAPTTAPPTPETTTPQTTQTDTSTATAGATQTPAARKDMPE
jgi:serine/threonine-protein kinase